MIIDTTYLLPLARVDVEADLLTAVAEEKIGAKMAEMAVSTISLFELMAKASRLGLPVKAVGSAIQAILSTFRVEPFHETKTIETSFEVREILADYIDCIIVATAAKLKEDLITQDSRILAKKELLRRRYGVSALSYEELLRREAGRHA